MNTAPASSEPFALPKRWRTPRPTFVVSLVAVLVGIAIGVGIFEITQSRKEIMGLLEREAVSLVDALALSGENAVRAYGALEATIERGLLQTAGILAQTEAAGTLTPSRFQEIVQSGGVARALAVNTQGQIQGLIYPPNTRESFLPEKVAELIAPLFQQGLDSTAGLVEDWTGATHYAVAVRRKSNSTTNSNLGAWVVCAEPGSLLEFRRRVGIGRLIQDIGEHREIAYIALQDSLGIISASRNIRSLPSLHSDPFLLQALSAETARSRQTLFQNDPVFEVVKPFTVDGETFGLFRVGLKMDAVQSAMTRTQRRAVAVGLGLLIVGVVLFNFLVTNQNYRLLTNAYAQIKTYTGNILENMADAVVVVDRHGRVTLFNRAAERLFGQSSREAVGKRCSDILGDQTSLLDRTLASGEEVRDREVSYRLNGRTATLLATTTLLRAEDGSIHSAVAVLKDLTEKKALEANLRQRERLSAMGELAAGVAHEIRNPLNAIGMIAQRFEREFTPTTDEEEFRQLARSIVTETRRVSDIIQRFLEFARPPELNLQPVDLSEVMEQAAALVESQAREQGVEIRRQLPEHPVLDLDPGQMKQVFLNLLQNSLHATPKGGTIELRIFRRNGDIVAEVADTGKGIPPEHLNKIFDLYFTTKDDGTGMGLSLSHRIVSQHGGRMEVESRVGQGTTMRVIFKG